MRPSLVICKLFLCYLLLISPNLYGQDYSLKTDHFTTAEGLSHNAVKSIYEDSRGLLWLCTRYGVNRFDGTNFVHYTREQHGLHSNDISEVMEDPDGVLWFLNGMDGFLHANFYEEFGYTLFDPYQESAIDTGQYLTAPLKAALANCEAYLQLPDKSLVFFSPEKYLIHYRGKDDFTRTELYWETEEAQITRPIAIGDSLFGLKMEISFGDGDSIVYSQLNGENGLFKKPLRAPLLSTDRQVPIHLNDHTWLEELKSQDHESGFYIDYRFEQPVIGCLQCIFPLLKDYPNRRLRYLDRARKRYYVEVKNGTLVFQEGKGLIARLDGVHFDFYVYSDRNGRLYSINQRSGLKRFTLKLNHFEKVGYPNHSYRKMAVDPQGKLWSGIDKGNYTGFAYPANDSIVIPHNQTVLRDRAGNIWVGMAINTSSGRLKGKNLLRRFNQGRTTSIDIFRTDSILDQEIWTIWEDTNDNAIWSANLEGDIVKFDPVSKEYTFPNFIYDDRWPGQFLVYDFIRCGNRQLWVSTSKGLYKINEKEEIVGVYSSDQSGEFYLPANSIHHVHIDSDTIFWLSTGDAGLLKWSPRGKVVLKQYTYQDGFPSMITHAAYEDERGFLWIPTEDGIVQFNKQTELTVVYGPEQGTSDSEYNRISHYRHVDSSLYFGGITGVTHFDPQDFYGIDQTSTSKDYLEVIDITRYNIRLEENETITNEVLQRGSQIELNETCPRANIQLLNNGPVEASYTYTSQLIGLQNEARTLTHGQVELIDIPYGQYELQIRAVSISGKILAKRSFTVYMAKPFYLSWWFVVLSTLAIVGLTLLFANLDNRRLRTMVAERTARIEADKATIEQQANELKELERLKSRFFANISHELRTPLTLVRGPLKKLLRRNDLPDGVFKNIFRASNNVDRLSKMVNDILDLSKLEDGKLRLSTETTLLLRFLRRTLALFDSFAAQREIELQTEYNFPASTYVSIDQDKLATILNNLITNAIKFSHRGGTINVRVHYRDQELTIKVEDYGRGIDARDLPHLFDRFYQAQYGEIKTEGGTGIGLSLSASLAELMDGQLSVQSQLGRGSTFTLSLKADALSPDVKVAVSSKQDIINPYQEPAPKSKSKSPQETILVVEDDPDLREYLTEIIEEHFIVLTAEHGKAALEKLDALPADDLPALIVTDLMMPEMDGFQLLRTLKTVERYALLPTIVLSARAALGDRMNALRIGVDDYLLKPFEEEELLQRIRNLLTNARKRKAALTETKVLQSVPALIAGTPEVDDTEWLSALRQVITQNLTTPNFGNAALAAEFFVSTRTLSRRTKALTGLSTNKFILEIRLETARRMLEENQSATVNQIAESVGFAKTSYFSTKFRERFGVSPGEYGVKT